jgi:hypothetical protein
MIVVRLGDREKKKKHSILNQKVSQTLTLKRHVDGAGGPTRVISRRHHEPLREQRLSTFTGAQDGATTTVVARWLRVPPTRPLDDGELAGWRGTQWRRSFLLRRLQLLSATAMLLRGQRERRGGRRD